MAILVTLFSFIQIGDGFEEDTCFSFSHPHHMLLLSEKLARIRNQNKWYQTPLGKKPIYI